MEIKKYATIKEMPSYYPFLTIPGLRHMINENRNGIKECVVKMGKRILIDLEKSQIWIDKQTLN